jgi:hypothetical protein
MELVYTMSNEELQAAIDALLQHFLLKTQYGTFNLGDVDKELAASLAVMVNCQATRANT